MGAGFKVWATGDLVNAVDFNNYIQEQVVMVFATTSARDSAISSPEEGMTVYISADNNLMTYSGSAWISIYNAQDSVLSKFEAKDYSETLGSLTLASNTISADVENGNVFTITLDNNVTTWNIANLPAGKASIITFIIKQDGTGSRLLSATQINSTTFKTARGNAITLSTGANEIDILTVLYDGNDYFVFVQPDLS